ncbi:MAG: MCP four helix bundle domain-containing protein [Candidatus Omnitrophica bacterium]|nr:MCP four helix bundle domain-containing protein [Candidatus Omnitrophota bacterium]
MVFLCAFTAVLAFITTRNMQKVFVNTMRDNVSSLKAAEELELALLSQRGFLSNYFLDGNPIWLKKLEGKKANFQDWLNKASIVALTPPEKTIIKEINLLYKRYESERYRAKKLYESGNLRGAKNILQKDMWETFEALYQKCEDYILINESIIKKSEISLQKKVIGMMVLIIIPAFVIIGLVGSMFFLLTRRILASVEDIALTTRNMNLKTLSGRVGTADLEQEMEYLAKSINMMLERLELSFEYIKDFSSSIGHELKTPLAIIKGESEIALRKERQAEDYRKALRVNIEEANRMIRIVEDLVFLAKLDYNPDNIKKEVFDFIPFFADIEKRAKTLAAQKQIDLTASAPETTITLEGNKLHLSRLFFNLIQNAVKFTPSGGKINLTVHPEGDVLKVSVSDTGQGISEEDLPKIFQRFFHKDKSQLESSDSIGLGLSIAKSIAKFHNGDIEVESKLQEGATFTVILPIYHA